MTGDEAQSCEVRRLRSEVRACETRKTEPSQRGSHLDPLFSERTTASISFEAVDITAEKIQNYEVHSRLELDDTQNLFIVSVKRYSPSLLCRH